ncbi:MAG TPA: phosphotransferase [Candidatus Paceibacterota bacterium]
MGTNFWLEAGGTRYFLRKYRPYGMPRIQEIHAAKEFFSGKELPVIAPLRTRDSETFFEWEGSHYALFPFVEGRLISRESLADAHFRNLGTFLAKLHLAGKNPPDIVREAEHPWSREKFLRRTDALLKHLAERPERDAFDMAVIEKLGMQKEMVEGNEQVYKANYPLHLTHNDYHENNVFFSEDDQVSHIFDWEKAQMGTRGRELARALELLVFNDGFDDISFNNAQIFLGAYNHYYPISPEELADGIRKRFMNVMHAVWIEEEHYFNGNNRVDILLPVERMRIDYYARHLDEYIVRLGKSL